jgi:hypothetical protein
MGVIDGFKVIDVDHDQAKRSIIPDMPVKFLDQFGLKISSIKNTGQAIPGVHGNQFVFISSDIGYVLNRDINILYLIVFIAQWADRAALLHIIEIGSKGIIRFKWKTIFVKLLGEKRKVPEGKNGFAVAQKPGSIQIREKIKTRFSNNILRLDFAVRHHPAVPFKDIQAPVQDDDTNIQHVENLGKDHL